MSDLIQHGCMFMYEQPTCSSELRCRHSAKQSGWTAESKDPSDSRQHWRLFAAVAKLAVSSTTAVYALRCCRAKARLKDNIGFKATATKQLLAPLRAVFRDLVALKHIAMHVCILLQGQGRVQGHRRVQGDSQEAAGPAACRSREACCAQCYSWTHDECTLDEQHDCCFWWRWRRGCCQQKSERAECWIAHDDRVSAIRSLCMLSVVCCLEVQNQRRLFPVIL
jgi:hypothetical protein